jgi:predicted ATPase
MSAGGLIGRDADLAELEERARHNRLVTLVGPGGVGKTALARTVADRLGGRYAMGVRLVDLTRIDDEQVVPGAIADQLGFDSFDALLSSPNDRPVLLVVDNCEHLLDAVAHVVVQVLGACHQPTVLATSRAPLELPGESILSLAPLPIPAAGSDAMSCPSVQLFLARCRDAGANVAETDVSVVADLCRRLDGLPLAIEIAAARARTMSVADIASRLADNDDVLDRPRFRGDPRHRSVADTIRWSYDLLEPSQAQLLEHVAVFAGPFSRAGATAVAGEGSAATLDADVDELVNASLVTTDTDGHETRYRLLDSVRRFALERLRRRDGTDAAYDRFVDHVLVSVQRTVSGTTEVWGPNVVRDLVALFDDIAEAMRWCLVHDQSPRRTSRLCSVLWVVVHQGHADDIAELARRTRERWPDDGSHGAAMVAAVLATAEYMTGHPDRALETASAAFSKVQAPGAATVCLQRVSGQARAALHDLAGAFVEFQRGAAVGHEIGLPALALELEVAAALVTADLGDVDGAARELRNVIERSEALGSVTSTSWARTALGWVMLRTDPNSARTVVDEALNEARVIGYPIGIALNLRSRAFGELITGDTPAAIATATELMHDLISRGALTNVRLLLDTTATIAHKARHPGTEQLVATARALPITTLAAAHFELIPLPATSVLPVARHDAIGTAWNVLAELAAATDAHDTSASTPVGTADPGAGVIRRMGDVCEFSYAGRSATIRTAKGVDDLVRLIEADGGEVHCLDLIGAAVEEASTGEVIDATARRNYEQRIRDLQADIDEAEANSDYARSYKHQAELDAIIEHLTAAVGLGQRTRRAGGSTERARSAVTHRVRTAIRQLGRLHPLLGRHLTNSVRTGTYCSYRPEQPISWQVD